MLRPQPSQKIKNHYDKVMRDIKGDYIYYRWGDSEIKRRHFRQTELALENALKKIEPAGDVLEIGCGPAVWTNLFIENARRLLLIDISKEMLEKAHERITSCNQGGYKDKVKYQLGDFASIPLEENQFDTIISIRAFEYMSDKRGVINKCYGILRKGGRLLISTKNKAWLDHTLVLKAIKNVPNESIPIGMAIQMDLVDWKDLMDMFRETGFRKVYTFPAVFGSYHRPLIWNPGLLVCDILHKYLYKRSISRMVNPLVESYLTIGEK